MSHTPSDSTRNQYTAQDFQQLGQAVLEHTGAKFLEVAIPGIPNMASPEQIGRVVHEQAEQQVQDIDDKLIYEHEQKAILESIAQASSQDDQGIPQPRQEPLANGDKGKRPVEEQASSSKKAKIGLH